MGASYGMGRKGGFGCSADLVRVPFADAMLFPLPVVAERRNWIGFADMALDAWRAVGAPLTHRPGGRVLVIGGWLSTIGIYAAGLAVSLGAGSTDYWDDDPERLEEAARYGAYSISRFVAGSTWFYEIVVDLMDASSIADAIRFVEPEGIITSATYRASETKYRCSTLTAKGLHGTSGVQMFEPRWMHFVLCVFVVRFTLSTSRQDSLRIKKLRRLG